MKVKGKNKNLRQRKQSFAAPGHRDKLKSDVFICLDKEENTYASGEVITGHVLVSLTSEVRIKEILVKCFGAARVSWNEKRSYTKGSAPVVSHKDTEVYLDHRMVLQHKQQKTTSAHRSTCCSDDDSILLARGDHKFPFEYTLPASLPRSYEGKWGHIKYSIKVILVRPWKFDIEREQEITIESTVDLNDDHDLAKPARGMVENPRGFLCFYSGWITAKVVIPRRGYTVGETLMFTAEVENLTPRKITSIRLALVQHTVFRIGDRSKKIANVLMSSDKGELSPRATAKWENEQLCIPTTPPSTPSICKAVQLRYTISLIIKGSPLETEIIAPITIVIGTVPLRRRSISHWKQPLARRDSHLATESLTKVAPKGTLCHGFLDEAQNTERRRQTSHDGGTSCHVSESTQSQHTSQNSQQSVIASNEHGIIAHTAQVHFEAF